MAIEGLNTTMPNIGSGAPRTFFGDLKHLNFSSGGSGIPYGAIGTAVGGLAGKLVGGGYESGVGQVADQLGNIGAMIPGPWGAVIGGGMKLLGGVANRALGIKTDQEALNSARQGTALLNNFRSNASTFDDIKSAPAVEAFKNPYKDGWFGNRGKKRNARLREERNNAIAFANRSVANNIQNVADEQMGTMQANYAAFGGPINLRPIEHELGLKGLSIEDAYNRTNKDIYAEGGPLHAYGADWSNGITVINNGGTHEESPYEGVPMGIAEDGQPNLVEEGEVIWNDYVFSNRLKVPDAIKKKYKLRGSKDMTFADAAKKAQKETEERPNDPISKRGMQDTLMKLMEAQEIERQKKQLVEAQDNLGIMAADGGYLFEDGGNIHIAPNRKGTFTKAATEHNMGVQEFASEVLAHPNKYSPAMRKKANFARNARKWKKAYGGFLDSANNLLALGGPTDPPTLLDYLSHYKTPEGKEAYLEESRAWNKQLRKDLRDIKRWENIDKRDRELANTPWSVAGFGAELEPGYDPEYPVLIGEDKIHTRATNELDENGNELFEDADGNLYTRSASEWHSFGGNLYSCGGNKYLWGGQAHKFANGTPISPLSAEEIAWYNALTGDQIDVLAGNIRGTKGLSKRGLDVLNADYYKTAGDFNSGIDYNKKRKGILDYAISGTPGIYTKAIRDAYNNRNTQGSFSYNWGQPVSSSSASSSSSSSTQTNTARSLLPSGFGTTLRALTSNAYYKAKDALRKQKALETPEEQHYNIARELRWVPAVGAGLGVFSDLMGWTNKPDYSNANAVLEASSGIRDVRFNPIGDRARYTPMDRMFHTNLLNAQAGSTMRNVLNTASGNLGTALAGSLAAGYTAQNQLGNMLRGDEEQNLKNYMLAKEFNRGTNMFNAEQALKAQIANNTNQRVRLEAAEKAAALRDAVDARVSAARSANLTNFFDSLGDIGREAYAMDMIHNNKALLYDWLGRYKGALLDDAEGKTKKAANGGYLTIKNKRRKK